MLRGCLDTLAVIALVIAFGLAFGAAGRCAADAATPVCFDEPWSPCPENTN